MKLTKESLKQIIKEELEAVTSEVITGKGVRSNRSFEEDPKDLTKTKFDWIINKGEYLGAAVQRIKQQAKSDRTKLGASDPKDKNTLVWKARNGLGIEGGSTRTNRVKDEYLVWHQTNLGQMPQWANNEEEVADAAEEAFNRALPEQLRPDRTTMTIMKGLEKLIARTLDEIVEQEFVKAAGIYDVEKFKQRYEANGGDIKKLIGEAAFMVTDLEINNLDEMSKSEKMKLYRLVTGSLRKTTSAIAKYVADNYSESITKKLKKRGFMDKAGSFVRGKGFKENKQMKLTKESLKQIIKEELEAVIGEATDGRTLSQELKSLGCKEGGEWGSRSKYGKDGTYDFNNGYIGFVDNGTLYEFYCGEGKSLEATEAVEAAGYRKGSVAIPSSIKNPGMQNKY